MSIVAVDGFNVHIEIASRPNGSDLGIDYMSEAYAGRPTCNGSSFGTLANIQGKTERASRHLACPGLVIDFLKAIFQILSFDSWVIRPQSFPLEHVMKPMVPRIGEPEKH